MDAEGATQLLPQTAIIHLSIVMAVGRCDHGAIGYCALCEGPCPSCSAPHGTRSAVKIPVTPWVDMNDALHCGLCGSDASRLTERPEMDLGFYLDCIGHRQSIR